MKILLIVESKHQGNTLKIANAMQEVAPIEIINTKEAMTKKLDEYDIVGFGSGIYFGKHDKKILKLADKLDENKGYSFIVTTSGSKDFARYNGRLQHILFKHNKVVLDTFSCLGLDKFFIFGLNGGINKGKPDENDIVAAQKFIQKVIKKYEERQDK